MEEEAEVEKKNNNIIILLKRKYCIERSCARVSSECGVNVRSKESDRDNWESAQIQQSCQLITV